MRPRLAALALALLLAALAACSGGAAPPEASPTPEAPSAPAPTAAAPPDAASTPAPSAEQDCLGGVAVASPDANPGLVADCAALLRAKDALRGLAPLDWSAGRAIVIWEGVAVGGSPPRVTGLDLPGHGLTGTIPPELGGLTGLTSLQLSRNLLTGTIPPELADLTGLTSLQLGRNRLTGPIPDLGGLPGLRVLDLHANRLSGGIPAWLGDAAGLAVLNLRYNRLTGAIPRSFGRLPQLRQIGLIGNDLTGCVPSALEYVGSADDVRSSDAAILDLPWCSPPRPGVRSATDVLIGSRSGLDLILPAPGALERRTFEDGEAIDWTHGIFILDAETGLTEGYAVAGRYDAVRPGGWIALGSLLLDRETGQSWRWPGAALSFGASSKEHLLFEERTAGKSTGRFIVANRELDEVARFSVDATDEDPQARFSPDGQAIALAMGGTVYVVPVESVHPEVLFAPEPYDGTVDSWLWRWDTTGLYVRVWYKHDGGKIDRTEDRYFRWDGGASLHMHTRCPGTLSPDGRYAARGSGGPYYVRNRGISYREDPWPSVVITDAETCTPIFRVRSAYWGQIHWTAEWLSTSNGYVVGVAPRYGERAGYVVAQVHPEPHLTYLPGEKPYDPWWPGPDPAPTGGGRYFGYGPQVYDVVEGRWRGPSEVGWGPFGWGDSHRERWFHIEYWGDGGASWLLLPPKIEYPPFSDEIAFRVARTGSCLRLREEPGEEGRVLRCLPDGERLLFAERDAEAERSPHPSLAETAGEWPWRWWVYVRTEDGAEGWVSHDWLDHD